MCSDGTYGNFYAFSSPANEKVGFKFISKVPCELLVCTHTLSLSLFFPLLSSLALLFLYVDDQKEIFRRSLVATIGYGGCAIS